MGLDKNTLSLLVYDDVNFMMKNNAIVKIFDFQNDDTWRSLIHHCFVYIKQP